MKLFCIFLINLYQRFISPRKGYRCAHAARFGGPSCSNAVKRIILDHGLIRGIPHIRARFSSCAKANQPGKGTPEEEVEKWYNCCGCFDNLFG